MNINTEHLQVMDETMLQINIPKIIHQIWYQGKEELPEWGKKYRESLTKVGPEWSLQLYDEDDCIKLIQDHYPWLLESFNSLPLRIMKIDFVRCLWLHKYGGFYMDVDIKCEDSLSLFLNKLQKNDIHYLNNISNKLPNVLLSEEWPFSARKSKLNPDFITGTISNSVMCSAPGHPIWLTYIEYILNRHKELLKTSKQELTSADVFEITGPSALWHVYQNNINYFTDVALLPCSYFQACGMPTADGSVFIPRANTSHDLLENQVLLIEKLTQTKNKWCSISNINKTQHNDVEDVFLVHHSHRSWDK